MSYEEEFDSIIRKKAEEMDFPFDEGNWEKASNMLDAQRTKAPLGAGAKSYWTSVVVSVAGVAIVVSVLGSYLEMNNESTPQVVVISKQEPVNTGSAIELPLNQQPQTEKAVVARKTEIQSAQPTEKAAKSTIAESAQVEATTSEIQAVKNNTSKADENSTPVAGKSEDKNTGPVAAVVVVGAAGVGSSQEKPSPSASTPVNKEDEPATKETASPVVTSEPNVATEEQETIVAENMPMIPGSLTENENNPQASESFNFLALYDDYYKKRRMMKQFGLEAGASWLTGWSTPASTDAKGFNWYAGMTFNAQLCGKIGIGTGLQAYNVSHITQPFYSHEGKDYHFGSTQTGTTITTSDLLYVAIPLQITYRLSNVNFVGLGVNAAYLSAASNRMQTYTVLDNVKTPVLDETNKGVYDGVNPVNLMLSASYLTQFCPRFAFKAEFNYGLTDLFTNNATIRNAERATGFRVGIRYTLLEK